MSKFDWLKNNFPFCIGGVYVGPYGLYVIQSKLMMIVMIVHNSPRMRLVREN